MAYRNVLLFFILLALEVHDGWSCGNCKCGVLLPKDPVVEEGTDLNLTCVLTDHRYHAKQINFSFWNGTEMALSQTYVHVVNETTAYLHCPSVDVSYSGTYRCMVNKTCGVSGQSVTVAYKLEEPRYMECIIYNMTQMNCTWDLGKDTMINTMYTLYAYKNNSLNRIETCGKVSVRSRLNQNRKMLVLSSCFDNMSSYFGDQWHLVVNAHNSLGTVNGTHRLTVNGSIVKPGTLTIKDRTVSRNSMNITLTTDRNTTYAYFSKNGFRYEISYISKWNSTKKTIEQSTSGFDGSHDTISIILAGLEENTKYKITVRYRPNIEIGGHWSDTQIFYISTAQAAPDVSPEIATYIVCKDERQLQNKNLCTVDRRVNSRYEDPTAYDLVYFQWKEIPEIQQNGDILAYILELSFSDLVTEQYSTRNCCSCGIKLLRERGYKITLKANTSAGSSNASTLNVLSNSNKRKPSGPYLIVPEWNKVTQSVQLFWNQSSSNIGMTRYTIYKCQGSGDYKDLGCNLPANFKSFVSSKTEYNFSKIEDSRKYKFSVSAEVNGESSGMVFPKCTYDYNAVPDTKQKPRLKSDKTRLTVEWQELTCEESKGYVRHYQVSYCELPCLKGTPRNVTTNNMTIIAGLKTATKYRVNLAACTRAGCSALGDDTVLTLSDEAEGFLAWKVGALVGGIAAFILLSGGLLALAKWYKDIIYPKVLRIPVERRDSGYPIIDPFYQNFDETDPDNIECRTDSNTDEVVSDCVQSDQMSPADSGAGSSSAENEPVMSPTDSSSYNSGYLMMRETHNGNVAFMHLNVHKEKINKQNGNESTEQLIIKDIRSEGTILHSDNENINSEPRIESPSGSYDDYVKLSNVPSRGYYNNSNSYIRTVNISEPGEFYSSETETTNL